jgi:hypothetical protein
MDIEHAVISCTGPELFFLSAVIGGEALIGVQDPFPGWLTEEIQDVMEEVQVTLAQRGYISILPDRQVMIAPAVAPLVDTITFPAASFLVTISMADGYTEQRTFHLKASTIAKISIYGSDGYRLMAMADSDAVHQHVVTLWGIKQQPAVPTITIAVPETVLLEARRLAGDGDAAPAMDTLIQANVAKEPARVLAKTLAAPRCNGALVAFRRGEMAWQTAGIGMLDGSNGLWRLRSFERQGVPWVEAIPCDAATLISEMHRLMARFVKLAPLA